MEMEPNGRDEDTILYAKLIKAKFSWEYETLNLFFFFCMLYFKRAVVSFFPLCGIGTSRSVAQDVCCSHFSISFGLQKIPLETRSAERRAGLGVAWLASGLQSWPAVMDRLPLKLVP